MSNKKRAEPLLLEAQYVQRAQIWGDSFIRVWDTNLWGARLFIWFRSWLERSQCNSAICRSNIMQQHYRTIFSKFHWRFCLQKGCPVSVVVMRHASHLCGPGRAVFKAFGNVSSLKLVFTSLSRYANCTWRVSFRMLVGILYRLHVLLEHCLMTLPNSAWVVDFRWSRVTSIDTGWEGIVSSFPRVDWMLSLISYPFSVKNSATSLHN